MDSIQMAFVIWNDIEAMLGKSLNLNMMKDSKQLLEAVTCGKRTQERRLSIEIMAARQSYHKFEISTIGFVRGSEKPADDLTKSRGNGALAQVMSTGYDHTS